MSILTPPSPLYCPNFPTLLPCTLLCDVVDIREWIHSVVNTTDVAPLFPHHYCPNFPNITALLVDVDVRVVVVVGSDSRIVRTRGHACNTPHLETTPGTRPLL